MNIWDMITLQIGAERVIRIKTLFICLDHYPYSGACTSLLKKMLQDGGMREQLGCVHILTIKKAYEEADTEIMENVVIHRVLAFSMWPRNLILELVRKKPIGGIKGLLAKLSDRYGIGKGFLHDELVAVTSKRLKELLRSNEYDAVIPICGHYEAGKAVLKAMPNSRGVLALYQVDPCATNATFAKRQRKKAVLLEKKLYNRAHLIITTPIIHKEALGSYTRQILDKMHTMEFPNVSIKDEVAPKTQNPDITCLFAGIVGKITRDPSYTVKLFSMIEDHQVKLHIVGVDRRGVESLIDDGELGENIKCHGKVMLAEAQKRIREADVLVNIGNVMTNQVPSKLFEYISACKPIINICESAHCPTIPYMERYPCSLVIIKGTGSPEEHARSILRFVREHAGRVVDKCVVLERFRECTAEYCAKKMCELLKEHNSHE